MASTYTFKSVDGGVAKFKKGDDGYYTPSFRPRIQAGNGQVVFNVDAGSYTYGINVASDTIIIDETATAVGTSTTYGSGGTAVTADELHDKLNKLYGANFIMAG